MKKSLIWKLCLAAVLLWLTAFGRIGAAVAAEDDSATPADRLQRLEQQMNELAQSQQQIISQLHELQEHQGRPMPQWRMSQERPMSGGAPNPENFRRPPWAATGTPAAGTPTAEKLKVVEGLIRLVFLVGIICNILLAVWIFTDIRKRGEGSGIFIALALVAGIPTAIIYSLVRIGDKKA